MKRSHELAVEKIKETRDKRKKWYDRNAVKREFQEGDLVLILTTCRQNKLAVQWKGPGRIVKEM